MKVVHISTLEDGGAGIAASRLHEGLLDQKIDSTFLCAYPNAHHSIAQVAEGEPRSIWKRAAYKIGMRSVDRVKQEAQTIRSAGGDFEYYSMPFSDYLLEKNPHILDADIINFHWVSNFVDFPTFFSLKKPIVWTFHDMNPIMGGFHYSADFLKNQGNPVLMGIEERYRKVKTDALQTVGVTVCAPSRWLYEASLADGVMGRFAHHHVPYGLNTQTFTTYPQDFSRQVFKLPLNKKIFLFVSGYIGNKRKGFHLLEEAVARISPDEDFIVAAVGYHPPAPKGSRIVYLDPIHDEALLPLLFSAADICVIPSLEDNLPNVMLESLCCGTPVLAYPIGGLKDTITDGVNGFLTPAVSADALAVTMTRALRTGFDRAAIRRDAVEKFDQSVQAKKYIAIYNSIS